MKKVLLALVFLAVVYGLVALALSFRAAGQNTAFNAQLTRLDALGRAAAPALADRPPAPLVEACQKLPPVAARELAAYFVEPGAGVADDLQFLPKRAVLSLSDDGVKDVEWPWFERDAGRFVFDLLGDTPNTWPWYLSHWSSPFGHDFTQAKYLVVHRLASLTRPRILGDDTYEAGELVFHSAVLDAQTGKVLCTGTASVTSKRDVSVRGRGKTSFDAEQDALHRRDAELLSDLGHESRRFGLGELCWLGGEPLCSATFRPFAPPKPD